MTGMGIAGGAVGGGKTPGRTTVPEVAPEAVTPVASIPRTVPEPATPRPAPETITPRTVGEGTVAPVEQAKSASSGESLAAEEAKTETGMKGHDAPVSPEQLEKIVSDAEKQSLVRQMRRLNTSGKGGEALMKDLKWTLKDFEATTGVKVETVDNGTLSKTNPEEWDVRQEGANYASLRAKPGSLLIEKQVYSDPKWLLDEMTHEFASYYTGGGLI